MEPSQFDWLWSSELGRLVEELRAGPIRCKWHRRDIAARACQKDRQAFSQLYEYYKRPFGRRLMALVNNQETVYDLYQDTFVRAWEYASPAIADYFESWLYRVARNLAIDHLRHTMRFEFVPLPSDEPQEDERHTLLKTLDRSWSEDEIIELLLLKEAIADMSPRYRLCLLLQKCWGFTQHEIAERLDISEKSVSTNVIRAYKQLKSIRMEREKGQGMWGPAFSFPEEDAERPLSLPRRTVYTEGYHWRRTPIGQAFIPEGFSPRLQQLWQEEDHNNDPH